MWADKDDYWLFAVIAFGLCIVFYLFASISYQFGYSDNAISLKMQAEGYIEWYNQFTNIQERAIEETINASCQMPNYPCENMKQGYQTYQKVDGLKDYADTISIILRITK